MKSSCFYINNENYPVIVLYIFIFDSLSDFSRDGQACKVNRMTAPILYTSINSSALAGALDDSRLG